MALRLHRVIGYGLDNLKTMHKNIVDDRFDRKAFEARAIELAAQTPHQFSLWTHQNRERVAAAYRAERPEAADEVYARLVEDQIAFAYQSVAHSGPIGPRVHFPLATGFENVMVFQPVHTPEPWTRVDDIIDFVDDNVENWGRGTQATFKRLRLAGIPPHDGVLVRYKPGDTRAPEGLLALKRARASDLDALLDRIADPTRRTLIQMDLQYCWRPPLPYGLVAGLVFLEPGIKDIYTLINDLRPVVYTFWY